MFGLGTWEIALILVAALIFIGPAKLPELAKTVGKGMREMRRAMNGLEREVRSATDFVANPEADAKSQSDRSEQPAALDRPADEQDGDELRGKPTGKARARARARQPGGPRLPTAQAAEAEGDRGLPEEAPPTPLSEGPADPGFEVPVPTPAAEAVPRSWLQDMPAESGADPEAPPGEEPAAGEPGPDDAEVRVTQAAE